MFQVYKLCLLRLYNWSVGLNDNKNVNFLGFVDCIMDESWRHNVFVFAPFVHG